MKRYKNNLRRPLVALTITVLFSACAVGPDFKAPALPMVKEYTPETPSTTISTPDVNGGEAQQFIVGQDIPGEWWTLFHSKQLNALIERSLKLNPSLKAAQAALAVAQENVQAQKGSFLPSVSGNFNASRQKTSEIISTTPASGAMLFNLYTPQVTVSYVPDVFGLNWRTVESLRAQEEQARFALAASHITLSSNVATAVIQEAMLREQINSTRQLIAINTKMLQLTRNQFARGSASRLDVAAQSGQLAQITATLPPLLKQLAQQHDLLAALTGAFPSESPAEQFELSSLQLPQELPLSLPSRLVAQRPDVRQAEENLHAACAQVGIAVANRLPNITLTANAGSVALAASQIFAAGSGFWTLAGSLTQPIFEGGTLLHRERAARAAFTQSAEQYRSTVLTAFQNVADSLTALKQDADSLNSTAAAMEAARTSLDLSRSQFESGHSNQLSVLTAEQTYQQAVIALIQARASRYTDTVALFQALGGGWWNRSEFSSK